jgi:antitoxin VapB
MKTVATAKLFKHGGSQAVRLPKAFRFEGTEVLIEKQGDNVLLRPKKRSQLAHLEWWWSRHPEGLQIERNQPKEQQKRDLTW